MLLVETIQKCTFAIQRRRTAQERKSSVEAYLGALSQLHNAIQQSRKTVALATTMWEKGIVEHPVLEAMVRDDLLECIDNCGKGVNDGTLTFDMVKVLKAKSEAIETQVLVTWKAAAKKYSEGTIGYLSMLSSISEDPKQAHELIEKINGMVEAVPSDKTIDNLVSYVSEARKMIDAFSLNPAIEAFLKKVSSQKATVVDLTPEVLNWFQEKGLINKLKIRF